MSEIKYLPIFPSCDFLVVLEAQDLVLVGDLEAQQQAAMVQGLEESWGQAKDMDLDLGLVSDQVEALELDQGLDMEQVKSALFIFRNCFQLN